MFDMLFKEHEFRFVRWTQGQCIFDGLDRAAQTDQIHSYEESFEMLCRYCRQLMLAVGLVTAFISLTAFMVLLYIASSEIALSTVGRLGSLSLMMFVLLIVFPAVFYGTKIHEIVLLAEYCARRERNKSVDMDNTGKISEIVINEDM